MHVTLIEYLGILRLGITGLHNPQDQVLHVCIYTFWNQTPTFPPLSLSMSLSPAHDYFQSILFLEILNVGELVEIVGYKERVKTAADLFYLGLLGLSCRCAIVIFSALINQHLGHRNCSTHKIGVVMQTLSNLQTPRCSTLRKSCLKAGSRRSCLMVESPPLAERVQSCPQETRVLLSGSKFEWA